MRRQEHILRRIVLAASLPPSSHVRPHPLSCLAPEDPQPFAREFAPTRGGCDLVRLRFAERFGRLRQDRIPHRPTHQTGYYRPRDGFPEAEVNPDRSRRWTQVCSDAAPVPVSGLTRYRELHPAHEASLPVEPPESIRPRGAGAWRHVVRWHAAESCPMPKSSRPIRSCDARENSCESIRSRHSPLAQIPARTRPAGGYRSHQANSGESPAGAERGISESARSAAEARRPYAVMGKTRTPAKSHSSARTAGGSAATHPHLANQGRTRRHGHEIQPSPSSHPASAPRIPILSASRRRGLHQPDR